jgi:hypothetical protein
MPLQGSRIFHLVKKYNGFKKEDCYMSSGEYTEL